MDRHTQQSMCIRSMIRDDHAGQDEGEGKLTTASGVEQQFARPFVQGDWSLFKAMADSYLQEAARLKRKHMPRYGINTLLSRNVRKRLLIGLGTELLIKALYLKCGYAINDAPKGGKPFPTTFLGHGVTALKSKTATFDKCLVHMGLLVNLSANELEGLRIAKVLRNKEAHSVLPSHTFVPETYRVIERSLVALYLKGFQETLTLTISVADQERARWVLKCKAQ